MKLRLSEQAQADIARIDAFWATKRPKNPLLFREQLKKAFELIETSPKLAARYTSEKTGRTYFKVPLLKTRDVIYYEYDEQQQFVAIVTIWSPTTGDPGP